MNEKKHSSISGLHRSTLITLALVGIISGIAWGMVITQLDPEESTATGLSLFYISLFFALMAFFTLLGFGMRLWRNPEEIHARHLSLSLRQGLLLSVSTLICLVLLMLDLLRWWNGLLVVSLATLTEFYFTRTNS